MKALAILVLIPFATLCAGENNGRGTRAVSLANAYVAIANDPWAVAYNPAGLAQILSPEVSTFFIPQQFGMPELRTVSLSAAYCTGFGTAGILAEQFGFDLYRSTEMLAGYGIALDTAFSLGVTLDVQRISIERYGASTRVTADVGILGRPVSGVTVGFCFQNVTSAKLSANQERLPQYMLLGISYSPISSFLFTSEIEKDTRFPLVIKAGVEQEFFDFLSLRCGVANNPDKFCLGLSVRYSSFEFGYAGYSHPELGWTHQVEVCWR